jgi:hypothetical protein
MSLGSSFGCCFMALASRLALEPPVVWESVNGVMAPPPARQLAKDSERMLAMHDRRKEAGFLAPKWFRIQTPQWT